MTGSLVGEYQLETLLGRGAMGEVYLAHDTRRNRYVALKLLSAHLAGDQDYRERFRRESYVAARLQEPHVIPIHDSGEIDGRLFIDMRLVKGSDLGKILTQTGPMPPRRAVEIISQIAEALDAAHADDLVHRDVKPANVLVTEGRDFVYLVDFGIAHAGQHAQLTATGTTIGTLDYMAPERFDGKAIDRRVDIYALACVLHESLTATRPFSGDTFPALMRAHLYDPPPKPSRLRAGIPPALDAVVARGMAKNPHDRYYTAGELANAARTAITAPLPETVIAPPDRPPPRDRPPPPDRPPLDRPPLDRPPPPKRYGRKVGLILGLTVLGAAALLGILFVVLVVIAVRADSTNPPTASPTPSPPVATTAPSPATFPTSPLTAATLFNASQNGTCKDHPLSPSPTYTITSYDIEVLECTGADDYSRWFYKYSGTSPEGWVSEIRSGRSNYRYDNLVLLGAGSCYDVYTATRIENGKTINTAFSVFRTAPFVMEVLADAAKVDLATVGGAKGFATNVVALGC